jgi:hypothetical protein
LSGICWGLVAVLCVYLTTNLGIVGDAVGYTPWYRDRSVSVDVVISELLK